MRADITVADLYIVCIPLLFLQLQHYEALVSCCPKAPTPPLSLLEKDRELKGRKVLKVVMHCNERLHLQS